MLIFEHFFYLWMKKSFIDYIVPVKIQLFTPHSPHTHRVYQTGHFMHFRLWELGFCPTCPKGIPIRMVLNRYMSPQRYNCQWPHTLTHPQLPPHANTSPLPPAHTPTHTHTPHTYKKNTVRWCVFASFVSVFVLFCFLFWLVLLLNELKGTNCLEKYMWDRTCLIQL